MATRLSPDRIAQKWANNLGASIDNMRQAIQQVRVNPAEQAIARADFWLQRLNASKQKWINRLRRTTLAGWQNAMISKGLAVIPERARLAIPKFQAFMTNWLQYQRTTVAGILSSMPRGSLDANIARAVAVIRANADYRTAVDGVLPFPAVE